MIFDAHGDIWTDVTVKRQQGKIDIFKKYHLEKYKKGNVNAGIFVIWIDPPYDVNPQKRALEIIENMSVEINNNKDLFGIIRKYDDIEEAIRDKKFITIIGTEGLSYIGNNVELLDLLYLFGVRHATLTWNEENELATGVNGDPKRGLTEYGVQAVKRMEQLGIIVDVSHLNEKSFWDVYNNTNKPFIASHSNCKAICDYKRNLTDEQLKAIKKRGGVVGLNAFADLVANEQEHRNIEYLVEHLEHMIKIMGIDYVGFGFDFDDYLESDTLGAFADGDAKIKDLENITKVPKLIQILEQKGYSNEDIEKIKYKNFFRVIKEILR